MAFRPHVLVVEARFYEDISDALFEGAKVVLDERGATYERVSVPGALEIPFAIRLGAEASDDGTVKRAYDGYVALGCVIRGDTPHFDFVAGEAASGLQLAALETGVPVSFGVLTLEEAGQADDRLEKGAEAVRTGLEMADVFAQLRAAAAR